jgi:hypothetical protein
MYEGLRGGQALFHFITKGKPLFVALRSFCPITYQIIRISGYQAVDIRIAEYQEAATHLIPDPLVFCTLFS